MKKKNLLLCLLLLVCAFIFAGCQKEEIKYNVNYYVNDEVVNTVSVNENTITTEYVPTEKEGQIFMGWYIDEEFTTKFDFNTSITSDTTLYGYYLIGYYRISFVTNCDTVIEDVIVKKREKLESLPELTKKYYKVEGWYTDEKFNSKFDIVRPVTQNLTLYAKWVEDESCYLNINYVFEYECWINKDALYTDFYSYFYDYMKNETDCNLSNITKEEFLTQGKTWEYNGRSDMYHFGDMYSEYYVKSDVGGSIEGQVGLSFIGYCYENNRFVEVIHHLETFFEYWRTDEGYSQTDPLGNDFYAQPWASMVDTAKFFYFTADTLQTKYSWFDSARVKKALDEIPGININKAVTRAYFGSDTELLTDLSFIGYTYNGLYSDQAYTQTITKIIKDSAEATVYVSLTKNN